MEKEQIVALVENTARATAAAMVKNAGSAYDQYKSEISRATKRDEGFLRACMAEKWLNPKGLSQQESHELSELARKKFDALFL